MSKLTNHFRRHKTVYLVVGASILSACITAALVRHIAIRPELLRAAKRDILQSASRGIPATASRGIPVTGQGSDIFRNATVKWFSSPTINIEQVVDSHRRGAPSWVVRCLETGDAFMSQASAASHLDIPQSELSKHLNGKVEHVRGLHFERICMAA